MLSPGQGLSPLTTRFESNRPYAHELPDFWRPKTLFATSGRAASGTFAQPGVRRSPDAEPDMTVLLMIEMFFGAAAPPGSSSIWMAK